MRKAFIIALGLASLGAIAGVQPAAANNCVTTCTPDRSQTFVDCSSPPSPRPNGTKGICQRRYLNKCVTTCSGSQGSGGPAPSVSDPKLKSL